MKRNILRILFFVAAFIFLFACGSGKDATSVAITEEEKELFNSDEEDTLRIADEETEYEIIIIEPGFYNWLNSIAKPKGYYSQSYMENRNQIYVMNWNQRVLNPMQYNPDLYQWQIDYDPNIDYGYDVNWKLYNYFIYFQRKYNQRLGPFLPRI